MLSSAETELMLIPFVRQMPVPYAALSHILTLFAHDVPTLALVQHVFDYILARPPIAVVYLAATVRFYHTIFPLVS